MADSAAGGSEHSARTTRTAGSGARDPCSSPRQPAQDAAAAAQGASLRGEQQRACRVPGCCEPLKAGYGSKYRICAVHYATPCLMLDGEAHRFCQQCGQVHLLSAFDEDRRSCRDSLRRHQDCRLARKKRARQRAQQALRDAGAAAASAAAPKAAARPKAAPAGKAGAPKAAPGGKAGAPKGAPAKAAAAGETGAAGAPRAAATAKAPKTAKRKRQAKGAEAGPVRPRKQQKPSQQQGKEGSQEQQQKPPQPQGEEGSQLPKLQTKPRAGVQQVPAAKRARSEAAPSSDGSTQDRADIFKEEPSLPLPVPQTPAAPRSPQRACQPAAEPAPPGAAAAAVLLAAAAAS